MLLNMYKEQLRCEKEPRFAHPDAFHSGPEIMMSPSSVDSELKALHMTKSIAIVIELPYVDFVKEYLLQVCLSFFSSLKYYQKILLLKHYMFAVVTHCASGQFLLEYFCADNLLI